MSETVLNRMESIALMNHNIRNALQAIACCSETSESAEIIRDSINRIDWVLSEVVSGIENEPKIPDEPPLVDIQRTYKISRTLF